MLRPADDGFAGLLNHDPTTGADTILGALGDEFVDEIGEIFASSSNHVLVDMAVEGGSLGAFLVGIGEDASNIEPRPLQEIGEDLDIGLGLAGEAGDEVRPEAGFRTTRTDGLDDVDEGLGVTEAAHPAQQRP